MGKLLLLILFYWVILLENGDQFLGTLIDLGGGLEIRLSLIFKLIFLVLNFLTLIHFDRKFGIPAYLIWFSSFLALSTATVLIISPTNFLQALSVNLHIQLMLNIILFVKFSKANEGQLLTFITFLRIFAVINAVLVILSAIFPDFELFNSMTSKTGIQRAFGIMGDEVSVFLTFFLYEAIISKKWLYISLYAVALMLTVGLGAIFTFLVLIISHLVFVTPKTKLNAFLLTGFVLLLAPVIFFSYKNISKTPIFQRITNISKQSDKESSALRMLSLQVAWEMIREKPILGHGYGNYAGAVREKYRPKFVEIGREQFFDGSASVILASSFNPYIQMLAESGIVGLIAFILFLIFLYRATKIPEIDKNSAFYPFYSAARMWLLVFFITTLSANWLLPVSFLFLLVVTLTGVLYKIKELNGSQYSQETV